MLLLLFTLIVGYASSAPTGAVGVEKKDTKTEDLFEGDLKISESMIRKYYNVTEYEQRTGEKFHFRVRDERAAASDSSILWSNGIVYYTYDSSIPTSFGNTIRSAMDDYERKTCLRFVQKTSATVSYINFTQTGSGCYSNSIGMKGGMQIINLQNPGCTSFGIIQHEIGHAIGFWHEQSRPDRDSYVNILTGNIQTGKSSQFMKRTSTQVDSLGVVYDYGSVMHYSTTAFSKPSCSGSSCTAIQVNNPTEYSNQGSPTIGQRVGLSPKDAQQVNLLYSCGVDGRLRVKVRNGVNLPDTDPAFNSPDPYVKIAAFRTTTTTPVNKQSSVKQGTQNPTWNEYMDFGVSKWLNFEVRIWDDDDFLTGADEPMSSPQRFTLTSGSTKNAKHCTNTQCSGYLWLNYYLCPNEWSGDNCGHRLANLRFYVRYGRDLPDEDGWLNDSDPYVEIIAYDSDGTSVRKTTSEKSGDESPDWNENLNFGTNTWKTFKIRVWDSDNNADDPLSSQQTVTISSGSHTFLTHNCHSGYIKYDYHFQ